MALGEAKNCKFYAGSFYILPCWEYCNIFFIIYTTVFPYEIGVWAQNLYALPLYIFLKKLPSICLS